MKEIADGDRLDLAARNVAWDARRGQSGVSRRRRRKPMPCFRTTPDINPFRRHPSAGF